MPTHHCAVGSAFGAVIILGQLTVYHHWLPIPGLWLLVTVLGTVLVII